MIKFTLRCHFFYIFICFFRYGCNLRIAPEDLQVEIPPGLMEANETAFVGSGGKYWLALYYTQVGILLVYVIFIRIVKAPRLYTYSVFQLSTYAVYFQAHGEYPWQSNRPIVSIDKGITLQLEQLYKSLM